jgi:hypothetical protein
VRPQLQLEVLRGSATHHSQRPPPGHTVSIFFLLRSNCIAC